VAVGQSQFAVWHVDYDNNRLPPILPPFSAWEPTLGRRGEDTFRSHLVPIPMEQLPAINEQIVATYAGQGAVNQYLNAVREGHSRDSRIPAEPDYVRDWVWYLPVHRAPGDSSSAYYLGFSQIGGFLINLVVADNRRFGQFVQLFITVIFTVIAQGVGAAVAQLSDAGVGEDGSLPPDEEGGGGSGTPVPGAPGGGGEPPLPDLGGVEDQLSGLLDDVEQSITEDVSSAFDSLSGSFGDIVGGIGDVLSSVRDTIGSLVSNVSDVFHTVTSTIQDINENLIKPITGPITSILENYKSLSEQLTRDLHSGVTGLLRIPGDISNALTSIDATMTRTVAMLGSANQKVIHDELGPGVGLGVTSGVEATRAALGATLDGYTTDERDHQIKHIHEDPSIEALDGLAEKILGILKGEYGYTGKVIGVVIDVLMMIPHLLLFQEPKTRHYHHLGNAKWPTETLDAATALVAWKRGIITNEDADRELAAAGFNPDRILALKALNRQLPPENALLEWEDRGFISNDDLKAALAAHGWREDDAARMIEANKRLPDVQTAIRWKRRGFIGQEELNDLLKANNLRFADQLRYVEDDAKQPGAGDVMAYVDRRAAIEANVAPESLNRLPERAVLDELATLGINERTAALLWVNHYTLLDPANAAQAWFRGYINLNQRNALYQAAGLVREQWENFTDLQRPLFTVRNVPTLLVAGIIDAQQSMDILRHVGYTDVDADRMVRYALGKRKPDNPAQADALHGLTSGTVTSLYDAGALDREQATALLVEMGFSQEAAQLSLTLRDVNNQAAERAAEANLVIAQARSGHYTFDEAQAALGQLGLSTREVAAALSTLERSLTARTKLPSEAQLVSMFKHGLLGRSALAQTLGLLGYSDSWSELLIQLAEGGADAGTTNE
jgi:hypothetical protein